MLAAVSDASSGHLRRCSDADTELAAASHASSGHLRRCSDFDTTQSSLSREKDASLLSWPTMMGN
eukprot:scaffold13330_cov206-Skeletonema_dohrnii-CCMP3373.AAC.2